jgi:hypothetical protein
MAAKTPMPLDRSAADAALDNLDPRYRWMLIDDAGRFITEMLEAWYQDPGLDMYAFIRDTWLPGRASIPLYAINAMFDAVKQSVGEGSSGFLLKLTVEGWYDQGHQISGEVLGIKLDGDSGVTLRVRQAGQQWLTPAFTVTKAVIEIR